MFRQLLFHLSSSASLLLHLACCSLPSVTSKLCGIQNQKYMIIEKQEILSPSAPVINSELEGVGHENFSPWSEQTTLVKLCVAEFMGGKTWISLASFQLEHKVVAESQTVTL